MSSLKEIPGTSTSVLKQSSMTGSPIAKTMSERIVSAEFKIPGTSVTSQVMNLRDRIRKKAATLSSEPKRTVSNLSPYFADLSNQRFAITSEEMLTPYDGLIALNVESEKSSFTVMDKVTVSDQDQQIIEQLTLLIKKLELEQIDLYAVDHVLSPVLEKFDFVISNLYYKKRYGTPLLGPILRDKKKPPKYLGPHWYEKYIVDYLSKVFRSPESRILASTVVRLLLAQFQIDPEDARWQRWIAARNSRTPTYEQLVFAGVSPDLKLKKYRTLFYQTEWDRFSQDGLVDLETDISAKQRTAVIPRELDHLIGWSKDTKTALSKTVVDRANLVKQKRLNVASTRRNAKSLEGIVKEGSLITSQEVYFTPFYIVTTGLNVSDGELLSRVKAVDKDQHYAFDEHGAELLPRAAVAAGIEYCKAISNGPAGVLHG
uniref:Coat protein n=1 Tax=Phytophthora cinnamomi ormycovirus 3-5 TaxID=3239322 RepID=A0AB39JEL4_9VIRU